MRYVVFLLVFAACAGKYDGKRCAKVFYNRTSDVSMKSFFWVYIDIDDSKISKIYFPTGAWLGTDHITSEKFDDNGYTNFTTDIDLLSDTPGKFFYEAKLDEKGQCNE